MILPLWVRKEGEKGRESYYKREIISKKVREKRRKNWHKERKKGKKVEKRNKKKFLLFKILALLALLFYRYQSLFFLFTNLLSINMKRSDMIRGCLHIMSAKNWWVQTTVPLVSQKSEFDLPPYHLVRKKRNLLTLLPFCQNSYFDPF